MFKVKYKNLSITKWLIALSLAFAVFFPQVASAATFYQNTQGGGCRSGDFRLNPPYTSGTKKYYCVGDLASDEYTGTTGTCPDGVARAIKGDFKLCLNKLHEDDIVLQTFIPLNDQGDSCDQPTLTKENCGIIKYAFLFINALSALVGVVIIAMIVFAGIEYSASNDDPQKISAAKGKIFNAILALLVFLFTYAFLQWVVPGGLF